MSGGRALRICSLFPSATEIVAALGLSDRLVGRSAECEWPLAVSRLPVVTAARIDTSELTSAAIDAAVRAALADGRSLYAVDAELITRLAPDLILTQACARSAPVGCAKSVITDLQEILHARPMASAGKKPDFGAEQAF
jgi:iron complex transport system substrate-binding protein